MLHSTTIAQPKIHILVLKYELVQRRRRRIRSWEGEDNANFGLWELARAPRRRLPHSGRPTQSSSLLLSCPPCLTQEPLPHRASLGRLPSFAARPPTAQPGADLCHGLESLSLPLREPGRACSPENGLGPPRRQQPPGRRGPGCQGRGRKLHRDLEGQLAMPVPTPCSGRRLLREPSSWNEGLLYLHLFLSTKMYV